MLEAQVHSELRNFLRTHSPSDWVHHLTMARMVARGLRLGRSAIIQTGVHHHTYDLSYLTPALLCQETVIIVTPQKNHHQLIEQKIPFLQANLGTNKVVYNHLPTSNKKGNNLIITDPQNWLKKTINSSHHQGCNIIIEEAEKLPQFINEYLTISIDVYDWFRLQFSHQKNKNNIQDNLAKLTQSIFSHPINPYNSYLLEKKEKNFIKEIVLNIKSDQSDLYHKLIQLTKRFLDPENYINYVEVNRQKGQFIIKSSPLNLQGRIEGIWQKKSITFIANYLSPEKEAMDYTKQLGIDNHDYTCLKFSAHAPNAILKLYIPEKFPFPNSPEFQNYVSKEISALVSSAKINHQPIIVIVEDVPLQAQITSILASQFGSRVKLNELNFSNNTVLVCGIDFWYQHQDKFPSPQLMIMATLPIPSLENPLVAAQVNYYKSQKKDWFRLYLLPHGIKTMQQLTVSLRKNQGVLALLDNRVSFRSYGNRVLEALEPYAKINYLDLTWLS
ncbi:ATP-dependent DNA helicase [Cyanobacterium stanieri PCC 7202]|uniref:ATP-dependent DNA helicase n=1 Tax=Cyanobacterium stanieri (strain ATCC 29140 / PCC 7202) TaxID=292563 RepID=K9YIJ7_CYASC|nr:ATP-dependent DNA helicase [Cyanobacterium stanieri PCC 7202]